MNLLKIFDNCPEYVIIKIYKDFPDYKKGQDIDIVCKDMKDVQKHLLKFLTLKKNIRSKSHIHLDYGNPLELRFDLYSEFISPKFTKDILDQRRNVKYKGIDIFIPSHHQDILIKCWEYIYNKKEKYKDYERWKGGLDAYKDR